MREETFVAYHISAAFERELRMKLSEGWRINPGTIQVSVGNDMSYYFAGLYRDQEKSEQTMTESAAQTIGNAVFAIETNVNATKNRIKGSHLNDDSLTAYLLQPLDLITDCIEKLKTLAKENA